MEYTPVPNCCGEISSCPGIICVGIIGEHLQSRVGKGEYPLQSDLAYELRKCLCFDAHEIFVPKLFPANPLLCCNIQLYVCEWHNMAFEFYNLGLYDDLGTQSFSLCYLLLLTQLTSWGALNETQTLSFLIVSPIWDNISAEVTKRTKKTTKWCYICHNYFIFFRLILLFNLNEWHPSS